MQVSLSLLASAAFNGAPATRPAMRSHSIAMVERSAAIPFLKKPSVLDGTLAGDVGFDPMGISTSICEINPQGLNYLREAELMHGRQAMLATVGFVFPSLVGKLPVGWAADVSTNPIAAQYELPPAVLYQLLFSIAIAEGLRAQIIFKSDSVAGEHGFDPMGFIPKYCDTPEKMKLMKLKEIKHGRIAMIAVAGFYVQLMLGKGIWPIPAAEYVLPSVSSM
jgi:light-harvesting complex I chlorophyll a/b binding protein 1